MHKALSLLAGAVVAVSTVALAAAPAASADPVTPAVPPARYVTLAPSRVLDTRTDGGPVGQGATRSLDLSRTVPATATAVVLNVTAADPTAAGYLTVFPAFSSRPTASSLNTRAGQNRSNSVTVALPTGHPGVLGIYNDAGSTQVVVDLLGYYDRNTGSSWYPSTSPQRYYDSREPGPLAGRYKPGDYITLTGPAGVSGVTAVALNITAVGPAGAGYLTAWSSKGQQPFVSTVNYSAGRTTPNFAVVPVLTEKDGQVSFEIQNNISTTDLVVDVVGYYAASGQRATSSSYVPVAPRRLSDTRPTGALGPNLTYDTAVPGGTGAASANLNITAVEPNSSTYVTVYAADRATPRSSNLNPEPGDIVPNAVQTMLSSDGRYRVYNNAGYISIVADLEGYFVPDTPYPHATAGATVAPTPTGARSSR